MSRRGQKCSFCGLPEIENENRSENYATTRHIAKKGFSYKIKEALGDFFDD